MTYLGLKNVGTVYCMFYRGEVPGARIGRTIRIDRKRLDAQLEGQRKKS
jgi:excisionase family DNA binding protein